MCLLRLNRRQACSPTAHSQGEAEETTCQVVERGSQWAPLRLVEVPWKGPGLQGPPQPAVPLRPGAFPGQRGTVCVLAQGQSGQPACLCQPPSHETEDKAGTRPDSPRSLFFNHSINPLLTLDSFSSQSLGVIVSPFFFYSVLCPFFYSSHHHIAFAFYSFSSFCSTLLFHVACLSSGSACSTAPKVSSTSRGSCKSFHTGAHTHTNTDAHTR